MSAADSLSIRFGPKQDVEFTVPVSMYEPWFRDAMPVDQIEPCRWCWRKVGIRLAANGQQFDGYACVLHGMTVRRGNEQFCFTVPRELLRTCFRLEELDKTALRPDPGMTDHLFPTEYRHLSEAIYELVQSLMMEHGAPVEISTRDGNLFYVGFDYTMYRSSPMRIWWTVDLKTGETKSDSRARCGN